MADSKMAGPFWPSAISSLLDLDLLSFCQHRQFRNPESGELTSDLFTDPRFEMVHIDRQVGPADLAKLASEDGRRQVFAGTSQLRHGIRERGLDERRLERRLARRHLPDLLSHIGVPAVQEGRAIVANQEPDGRD